MTGVIRYPHEKRQKKNEIIGGKKAGLENILLAGAFLGMMILPLLYVFTPLFEFADYQLPSWVSILGLVMIPLALWLFYRSHNDLGLNWSPSLEVRSGHSLVTRGVYQYVRHPMYTSIWIWCLIQALLLHNYIGGLSGLVFFGLLYCLRVGREEDMMVDQFGEEYQAYMKKTGRLLPKVG